MDGYKPPLQPADFRQADWISLDIETYDPDLKTKGPGTHRGSYIVGVALKTPIYEEYFPIRHESGLNCDWNVLQWLTDNAGDFKGKIYGANLLYDLEFLEAAGVRFPNALICDIQWAEPLLDEYRESYSLESLAQKYLGESKTTGKLEELYGKKVKEAMHKVRPMHAAEYALQDARMPPRIFAYQHRSLKARSLWDIYLLEASLVPLLLDMRKRGVRVDVEKAKQVRAMLEQKRQDAMARIQAIAPDLNPNSSRMIAAYCDANQIPYARTDKGNPSFTSDVLKRLAVDYPLFAAITDFRRYDKTIGTFIDGYIFDLLVGDRIYPSFHPLRRTSEDGRAQGTVTGRFACVAPWTPVLTSIGTIPIQDIKVGDMVWTHQNRWKPVTHTWIKGRETMYEITFSDGSRLHCTGQHQLLEKINYESFETVDRSAGKHRKSDSDVLQSRTANYGANCSPSWNITWNDILYLKTQSRCYKTQSPKGSALFCQPGRLKKFDVWEDTGKESRLERSSIRWTRVSDLLERWQKTVSPSNGYGETIGSKNLTGNTCCPSHRQKPAEQFAGQFSFGNLSRPQNHSYFICTRTGITSIKKINISGMYEVYDITVKDDESYLSANVFSHNSSTPNAQNWQLHDPELGPLIRSLLIPEDGYRFFSIDFSQYECRAMVHYAYKTKCEGAEAARNAYCTDPNTNYHEMVMKLTGLKKHHAKILNYAIAYGAGRKKKALLLDMLGKDGEPLPEVDGLIEQYNENMPFVQELFNKCRDKAQKTGYVKSLLGRRLSFPFWVPKTFGQYQPLPYTDALKYWPNEDLERAETYKSMNRIMQSANADTTKKAMSDIWKSGLIQSGKLYISLTVHDELCGGILIDGDEENTFHKIKELMENAISLEVPVLTSGKMGESWLACHE